MFALKRKGWWGLGAGTYLSGMRLFGSRTTAFAARLAAVALTVAAAGALGTATANAAPASSGGGCLTWGGYFSACISASGSHLEPNFYTTNNANCASVTITVINNANNAVVWEDDAVNNGCALGIHGPWALDTANSGVTNGGSYAVIMYMTFKNGTNQGGWSPNETLSY